MVDVFRDHCLHDHCQPSGFGRGRLPYSRSCRSREALAETGHFPGHSVGICAGGIFGDRIAGQRPEDGRYANSPLHEWFNQLKSAKGLCCSFADGATVEDPDWNISDGHYRVRIDANWYDVPDDAVIAEPNRFGKTMVWPFYSDGRLLYIRCFMPGDLG